MLISLLVLFSFEQVFCSEAIQPNDTDAKLIDILKNDLRRNNIDYIDKFNNSSPSGHTKQEVSQSIPSVQLSDKLLFNASEQNNSSPREDAIKRRYLNMNADIDYNKYSFSPKMNTFLPLTTSKPKSSKIVKSKSTSEAYPKFVAKSKREQFKGFIGKNQQLIDKFFNKKGLKSQKIEESEPGLRMETSQETSEMISEKKSQVEIMGSIPSPDQIDLSPAVGSRVERLRVDGRLCDRNVLVPEGPKYDSAGMVYLMAFSRGPSQRDYPRTRAPRIVLPRCCNCCKKSVLGCQ